MKQRNWLLLVVLVLAISLGITVTVGATGDELPSVSTGTMTVDCLGVRYQGTVAAGEQVKLTAILWEGPEWPPEGRGAVLQQTEVGPITSPTFDEVIQWTDVGIGYRVAIAKSIDGGITWKEIVVKEGDLDCEPPPPPPGGEGCTPGYWKNHFEDWPPTGLSPDDIFSTVFGVDLGYPTLGDAIFARGGQEGKLARHGTAALLSALHPDVDSPLTAAMVIALVQAGDADPLVAANELGCEIP